MKDHVDAILEQWRRGQLDGSPMAVVGRISSLSRLLQDELERVFSAHGLNSGEFDVLASRRRSGAPFRMAPAELSRSLMVTSAGLTKRLKALEAADLVRRRPHDDDARSVLVELTAKGRKLVETVVRAHVDNEERLLASLDARSRRDLARLLRKLPLGLSDGNNRAAIADHAPPAAALPVPSRRGAAGGRAVRVLSATSAGSFRPSR